MGYKICFYIRVSTEEQAENPEGSIKNQEERLKEVVKFKNQTSDFGEVVGVYIDRGRSGKDTNRPELQKMLEAIRKNEINLLMVTELSRVSRSIKDFAGIWEMMQENNCGFYSLRENFDTTTAAGEMVLYSLANIAQFERRQVSERVAANIRARAQRGLYNGGHVPLGYRLIPDKPGFLEIDPEMSIVVKSAFTTFLKEKTLSRSAKALNAAGHRIKRQSQGGGRFMRLDHFMVDNLHKILRNKAYIGVKVFKDKKGKLHEATAVWPPLIDAETFERAQKQLTFNCGRQKPKTVDTYPYLLSGLVYCDKCGSPMCGKSAHGKREKFGYYEHSWLTKRNSTLSKKLLTCTPHRVLAKKLEPVVWDEVKKIIVDQTFARNLLTEAIEAYHNQSDLKEKDNLKAKIHGYSSQLDAIAERLTQLPKSVSPTPFFKQMEKLERLKKETEAKLLALKGKVVIDEKPVELKTFEAFLSALRVLINDDLDTDTKIKLIQKLVHKVRIKPEGLEIEYFIGERYFERELVGNPTGARSFFMPKAQGLQKKRHPYQRAPHSSDLSIFSTSGCSNNLTIGALRVI